MGPLLTQRQYSLDTEQRMDREIGDRLRALRRRAMPSLEDLSSKSGLPIEELADHEDGTLPLPLSRALLLCEALGALGASVSELLPGCRGC
jgi:hypothetical protein